MPRRRSSLGTHGRFPLRTALDGCRIARTLDGTIEIAKASPANRAFPARITESLGVCLKYGSSHDVRADGRRVVYPSEALCIRQPGCVWSTVATGPVGFLSIDIPRSLLPAGLISSRMIFGPSTALPAFTRTVEAIRRARTQSHLDDLVTSFVLSLEQSGAIRADEFRQTAPAALSRRARATLEELVAEPPTIAELARQLGTSRFALMRRFAADFGITPYAFVLRLRVERARDRLAHGAELQAVAHDLGFADQAHFTRIFKRIVGITPGEYARHTRAVAALP
jgi:AraC-like DNA-binding protein